MSGITTLRQALSQTSSFTTNGALSLSTTQPINLPEKIHGRTAFFFKVNRSLLTEPNQVTEYLAEAHNENVRDALVLGFHLRNCRGGKGKNGGGKGERSLFRLCVEWYVNNGLGHLITKNLSQVVKFGRWDDVLVCPGGYEFIANQLLEDYHTVTKYLQQSSSSKKPPITLAAKWAPSACSKNKKSKGKHLPVIKAINEILNRTGEQILGRQTMREVEYRKMLSTLREYCTVIERLMCLNRWEEIDFNTVPSNAMHLYGKNHVKGSKDNNTGRKQRKPNDDNNNDNQGAFLRHRHDDFIAWREALKVGKTVDGTVVKVNASQLFPHQLVGEYLAHKKALDEVVEAQWKVLEDNLKQKGTLKNVLFVADVSGSMTSEASPGSATRCLDVSVALSLLGARCSQGKFENMIITFSNNPNFFEVKGSTLKEAANEVSRMEWGMTTNLQNVFDLILTRATLHHLTQDEMPRAIVIISDMQFNVACADNTKTNFEVIEQKYLNAGYKRPALVFWNVSSSSDKNEFPVSAGEQGTVLLSGYSPSMMNILLDEGLENLNPWSVVRKVLDDEVYREVVV
jgi:hypothetical protein